MISAAPFDRRLLLISLVLIMALAMMAGGMAVYVFADPGIRQSLVSVRAMLRIDEKYVDEIDRGDLIRAARQGIVDRLDRYSGYVSAEQFQRMEQEQSGGYTGIGVTVLQHEIGLQVIDVYENGPAEKAGIINGDVILRADSVDLAGMSSSDAIKHVGGDEGTAVILGVLRPAESDTISIEVTRGRIPFVHVPYSGYIADSIVYVRLDSFGAGASESVRQAIDSLLATNPNQAKGLILDLRGNPGGLLMEAIKTASLFLEEGTFVVGTNGRSRWQDDEYFATGPDITDGLTMAVLVDSRSASSSEIVAGALQQAERAVLVGDTTFGKGLVQGFVQFLDGDGLRLTMSRYYLQGGIYLNDFDSTFNEVGRGLPPDYFVPMSDKDGFIQALESSYLLDQFAQINIDNIIEEASNGTLGDQWLSDFAQFCREQNFAYQSPVVSAIELLTFVIDSVETVNYSGKRTAELMASLTDHEDEITDAQFVNNKNYIKNRLRQIAWLRNFGSRRAYSEVIVKTNPIISYSVDLLLEHHQ